MRIHELGTTKVCTGCNEERQVDCFYFIKDRNAYMAKCKVCYKARHEACKAKNPEVYKEKNLRAVAARDKEAHAARNKAWRKDNPAKVKEQYERCLAQRGGKKLYKRATYLRRPESFIRANLKRQKALSRAIPGWYNADEVNDIYALAKRLGSKYHVDHIVPLQGTHVCGLHVQTNLRIILAEENLQKGNKFVDDIVSSYARA
jgi:hypothetical protein